MFNTYFVGLNSLVPIEKLCLLLFTLSVAVVARWDTRS